MTQEHVKRDVFAAETDKNGSLNGGESAQQQAQEPLVSLRQLLASEPRGGLTQATARLRESAQVLAVCADFDQGLIEVMLQIEQTAGAQFGGVFSYEAAANILQQEFWFEDGLPHRGPDPEGPALLQGPFQADLTPFFHECVVHRRIVHMSPCASLRCVVANWHLENGRSAACAIPIISGDRALGVISLAWTTQVLLSPEQLELILSLSDYAALVLHFRQLEKEARTAAVAAERLAELSRLNQALRNVNSKLATETNPTAGLRYIIAEGAKLTEADAVLVLRYNSESEQLRAVCGYLEGEAGDALPGHPAGDPDRPISISQLHFWSDLLKGETRVVRMHEPGAVREISYDWHERHGFRKIVRSALLLGTRPIGMIAVAYRRDEEPTRVQFEAHANMAQQATFALRMMTLAEERTAGLAMAYEELDSANKGMRHAITGISGAATVEDVLADLLSSAIRTVGARSGAVVLAAGDIAEHVVLIERGAKVQRETQEQEGTWRVPINASLRDQMQAMRHSESIWAPPPTDLAHAPAFMAHHRKVGNKSIRNVPLLVADRLVGWMGLGFADPEPPSGDRVLLLRALADQMTVAVELYRLTQEAERAAIARAKAKAAEDRAAELAAANEALRRSVSRLAEADDVDAALVEAVRTAAEIVDAHSGALGVFSSSERGFRTLFLLLDGKLKELDSLAFNSRLYSLDEDPIRLAYERFTAGETVLWCQLESPFLTDDSRAYLVSLGLRSCVLVGVRQGEKCAGYLNFATRLERDLTVGQRDLLRLIADQISLMLELSRLAKLSEQAAIAREQEAAARGRARELTKANDAMKRIAAKLSGARDLSVFLNELLLEICVQLEADAGHLTIYHAAARTLHTEALVQDGKLERVAFPVDFVLEKDNFFDLIVEKGRPVSFDFERDAHLFFPGTREYHAERGHTYTYAVPLLIAGEPLGHIGIATKSAELLVEEQLGLLEALAQQAALALQLHRLSEEAKRRAIVYEQEEAARSRAKDLAKANEALRRGVDRISADNRTSTIVANFLAEALASVEAAGGAILLRSSDTQSTFRVAALHEGRPVPQHEIDASPYLANYVDLSTSDPGGIFSAMARGECPAIRVQDLERVMPAAYQHHHERNHQILWHVPLRLKGELVGFAGIAFSEDKLPSNSDQETIAALAQQLVLALELTRLAEEAKEVAVAREQETAVRQRVAELTNANTFLRDSVHAVAQSSDFDQSLSEVVLRIAEAAAANEGHLFVYDNTDNTLRTEFWFECGEAHWGSDPSAPELLRGPFDADITSAFRFCLSQQKPVYLDLERVDDNIRALAWPGTIEWHLSQGRKAAAALPITAGDQPLGILGLSWTTKAALTQEQIEVLTALCNQAALVMQLRYMEREAREQAVLHEKTRATTEERNRIAREMHDTLAQGYVGILMQLQVLRDSSGPDHEAGKRALDQMEHLARTNLLEARRSIAALRPKDLEEKGLIETLRKMLKDLECAGAIRTELITTLSKLNLPSQVEDEIQRIVQEALHNVLKHANADSVTLTLDPAGATGVRVSIYDNGRGFSTQADRQSGSFGMQNMRDRASRIAASLTIASEPGAGCEVILLWPGPR